MSFTVSQTFLRGFLIPAAILKNWAWVCAVVWLGAGAIAEGNVAGDPDIQQLKRRTTARVKDRLQPLLDRYCRASCQIVHTQVDVAERVAHSDEMGFEGLAENSLEPIHEVKHVFVTVQIDKRVSTRNRERLDRIITSHLGHMSTKVHVHWLPLEVPRIGASEAASEALKERVIGRVSKSIYQVINTYCPNTCILSSIIVDGQMVTPDQVLSLKDSEYVADHAAQAFMKLDAVSVELTIDRNLGEDARNQILELMRAKTRFYHNVEYFVETPRFPESFERKRERQIKDSDDPYGLDKLRHMLTLFRDLAGTKEIISNSTQTSDSKLNELNSSSSLSDSQEQTNWPLMAVVLLVLGLAGTAIAARIAGARRDAQLLSIAGDGGGFGASGTRPESSSQDHRLVDGGADDSMDGLKKNYMADQLKRELTELFIEHPKVAKETFARLLLEEGVEETAKYVHIFGKVVVFELLDDPSLQRRLYELSDYYHKSSFDFDIDEQLRLLNALKTRVTANEIRVLTTNTTDQFDFLTRLDPTQIFNLVKDEGPHVQSIVMTQLSPKRRRSVFDMFTGQPKMVLLKQLSSVDAIPKEYLMNVAKALGKKVLAKPEFDTQNLRSSDILLDLLEKASLAEQRELMASLGEGNQDAARAIKSKLVTVQMLPYLKDGHLLELVLGLNQDDLTSFLAGCPSDIRRLLLSHAPPELAESWIEELENIVSIDESKYRLVELAIHGKIRQLAANGAINILDINDMIFALPEASGAAVDAGPARDLVRGDQVVA